MVHSALKKKKIVSTSYPVLLNSKNEAQIDSFERSYRIKIHKNQSYKDKKPASFPKKN